MRQTKNHFCLILLGQNVEQGRNREKKRKRRKKKKKKKKEKSKKVWIFGVLYGIMYIFGFLCFLVWIIGPLYGFPWFLGF